jgi:hypothetical protein
MDDNRKAACALFGQALGRCLITQYGRIPSAAKFADAFNLRAHGTTTISRETARKWLNGSAIPEVGRLKVLISWVGLKPAEFLEAAEEGDAPLTSAHHSDAPDSTELRAALMHLLRDLDERSAEVVFLTAWALRQTPRGLNRKIDYQRLAKLLN